MKLETLTRDALHEERAFRLFRPSTVLGTLSFVEGRRTVMNHAGYAVAKIIEQSQAGVDHCNNSTATRQG